MSKDEIGKSPFSTNSMEIVFVLRIDLKPQTNCKKPPKKENYYMYSTIHLMVSTASLLF